MADKGIVKGVEQLKLAGEGETELENIISSFGKEYQDVDKMMDAINSALDDLESQSDALYAEAQKVLEETNRQKSLNQADTDDSQVLNNPDAADSQADSASGSSLTSQNGVIGEDGNKSHLNTSAADTS